jgi:hypothetical protein|tara:strand:+ start:903 stop:1097 length:195 start_codon:yes stop_codon:yes gene_type:complete
MFKNKKNILIIVFIILGLYVILDFRDHNFKRAIDACVAGSKKLDQPMTKEEAKKFCEEQIKEKK